MELSLILLGENDEFLHRTDTVCQEDAENESEPILDAPPSSKFDDDVTALRNFVGDSEFQSGLSIEITLQELLNIVPRQRRRTDAYNTLVKHLKDNYKITLKITKK